MSCKRWQKRNIRFLFIGLDAAGKTTILYQLKLGEVVTTIPTIGFNVETIDHGNVTFTGWDVGLRSQSRVLLRHYYIGTEALVFVIDCNDRERYNEAVDELRVVITEDVLREVPILVFANKQDLGAVMSHTEIHSDLMVRDFMAGRTWEVFPVSGLKGEGLTEGLDWLTAVLTSNKNQNQTTKNDNEQSDRQIEAHEKDLPKMTYFTNVISYVKQLFVR